MNILFSCEFFSITEDNLNLLEATYPGVNVPQELRKMDVWLQANPSRRKKSYPRFITNWLAATHHRLVEVQTREAVRVYRSRQESRVGTYEHAPVRVNPRLLRQA